MGSTGLGGGLRAHKFFLQRAGRLEGAPQRVDPIRVSRQSLCED